MKNKHNLYTLGQAGIILDYVKKLTRKTMFIHNRWYNKVYSWLKLSPNLLYLGQWQLFFSVYPPHFRFFSYFYSLLESYALPASENR